MLSEVLDELGDAYSICGFSGYGREQIDYYRCKGFDKPMIIVANTIKGKGVKVLEDDPLSHIANLNEQEARYAIDEILGRNSKIQTTEVTKKTTKEKLEESRY